MLTAYACCPNVGSEAGNGWSWTVNYARNGYQVHVITSLIYKKEIAEFLRTHPDAGLQFYFADSSLSFSSFKIPVFGNYIHYYWWILKTRRIIKRLSATTTFSHAHHITYSSIKFGCPLFDLGIPTYLGPIGGSELPDKSLKKYLGRHYYFEYFKNGLSYFLAAVNPSVKKSIQQAAAILSSNAIADALINKYTVKEPGRMFDAGLADYFVQDYDKSFNGGTVEILWTGTMFPRKGLNLAIDAVSRLPQDLDFHFTVLGDGQLRNAVEKQTAALGLQQRITFKGHVSHMEVMKAMQQAHILLFPSLIDSCPTQVFEAFAVGLPVVTLDHQGMHDQVSADRGIKIAIGKGADYPQLLADAICSMTGNAETYLQYSKKAYLFGQQQIWSKRINEFLTKIRTTSLNPAF